ncbi:MAG: hypothetical protein HIU88_10785 [Acidobacteria bacterium]|nr:hypothetical protein [Acidobacteriota bacterium]
MTSTLTPGTVAAKPVVDHPAPRDLAVVEAIAGIFRVEHHGTTIGYVQETGQRYVALLGPVYNTSVEVAQTLTLESAVRRLTTA